MNKTENRLDLEVEVLFNASFPYFHGVRVAGGKGLDLDRTSLIMRNLARGARVKIGLWTASVTAA